MADAGTGLDAGNLGLLRAAADQTGSAAGDQQIDQAHGSHELFGTGVVGVLHKAHQGSGETRVFQTVVNGADDRRVGTEGLAPAAQNDGVAGLQCEYGGVRSDVRAAFINNGDDAEGNGSLLNHETVGAFHTAENLAFRIGQCGNLADALGHAGDALRRQGEAVDHHLAVTITGGFDVFTVRGENLLLLREQPLGNRQESGVFPLAGCGQSRQRGSGLKQNVMCFSHVFFLPIKRVPMACPSRTS